MKNKGLSFHSFPPTCLRDLCCCTWISSHPFGTAHTFTYVFGKYHLERGVLNRVACSFVRQLLKKDDT